MERLRSGLQDNKALNIMLAEFRQFGYKLFLSFKLHILFFFFLSVYYLTLAFVEGFYDIPVRGNGILAGLYDWLSTLFNAMIAWVIITRLYHVYFITKPDEPIPYFINDALHYTKKLLIDILPIFVVIYFFVQGFSLLKSTISFIQPFSFDISLMKLDRWLHFGQDPWRLLQPLLGYYWVTLALNYIYNIWFFVLAYFVVWLGFSNQSNPLRMQFFVASFLSWFIGGFVLATLFSSAGPAFYGRLDLGSNPYSDLMAYLREVDNYLPVWALQGQDMIWNNYLNGNAIPAASISAMPSMHNIMAALIGFITWRLGRWSRIFGIIFVITIFLGSIHLGWHYAADAYLGFIIAFLSWWLAGRITKWHLEQPSVQSDLNKIS